MAERYEFSFTWDSPYGLMARLLESHVGPDQVILDLGCGYGAIAEPLSELGYEYVGCDVDPMALESLRSRGFETHRIDLTDLEDFADKVVKVVAERRVGALIMLDSLEHLPDLQGFLAELRASMVRLDHPLLGLSVPNVGHFDVGAKLVMGAWDVTPAGLLDETHLQFFTEHRLLSVLRARGWFQLAGNDVVLHHSDQHFPPDHPVLADGTPLRNLLWQLRRRIGDGLTVNQFVRLFSLTSADIASRGEPEPGSAGPFLSVLVRTQGFRMPSLLEALTCLAAQTDDDFEVQLLVHTSRSQLFDDVHRLVGSFAPTFAHRVRIRQVPDGGRARPLNVGLEAAAGRYVAFLDDDDLVTADWVERFRAGVDSAPGEVVRGVTVDRQVSRNDDDRVLAPYHTVSGLLPTHNPTFNVLEHFSRNRTPICSFAVPMEAVRSLGVRFDESAAVLEDWNFLLNLALVCGVHDTGVVTSVYHRWEGAESSVAAVDTAVWDTTHRSIIQRLDTGPLLLPAGSAGQIAALWEASLVLGDGHSALERERSALQAALDDARRRVDELEGARAALAEERQLLEREVALARQDAADVRNSTTWRLSSPARALVRLARIVLGQGRRRSLGK